LGVPNFFIDSFRIPPFLLPIYQAAGIEYDVPWQVLAAINEIETDYGRNLSISSAGAVGWMQFLPSTWKRWGVDANGDGVADPYNPVDAIFTAARYLQAAGAAKNLPGAIFAYNHAGWYVQSVLLRAKLIGGVPEALIGALSGLVEGRFPVAARAT
jgi:soluble lytic murein transglycosylase-like protein